MKFKFIIEEDKQAHISTEIHIVGHHTKVLATLATMLNQHEALRELVSDALFAHIQYEEKLAKMPKPHAEA